MRMNDLCTLIPNMVPLCICGCLAPSVLVTYRGLVQSQSEFTPGREEGTNKVRFIFGLKKLFNMKTLTSLKK